MYQFNGITIHNSGNSKSAREIYYELNGRGQLNLCHFLVDEDEVIMTTSLETHSNHTGKGYDQGNLKTISIEICRSRSSDFVYYQSQSRAIDLIKKLLKMYQLTLDDIYFHSDFDAVYCPHRILSIYKNKRNFIKEEFENGN